MIHSPMLKYIALVMMHASPLLFMSSLASAAPQPLRVQKEKALHVGKTLHYDKNGLIITFLAVKKDHRCPFNATCISAGDAEVVLKVKVGNQKAKVVSIHTNSEPNLIVIPANKLPPGGVGIPKSYGISIGSLNPLPYAGKKTPQGKYRLRLAISTAV